MRALLVYGIVTSLAFSGSCWAEKAPADKAKLFEYGKPLGVPAVAGGTVRKAKCCDITEWKLPVPTGGEMEMTVVAPLPVKGKVVKHPTVLWLHREGAEVKRAAFIQEAEALAASGIAALLVELPFKEPYKRKLEKSLGDAEMIRNAVVDARVALDWAATRPDFNIDKVALVGHRYGAWAATLMAAVDPRVDAAVLMSPPGKPSGWLQVTEQVKAKRFRETFDAPAWGEYLNSIEPLDPEKWIGYAAPAKLHFQFATADEWVQTLEQVDLWRAASQPKTRQMFESDELLNEDAKKDRHAWLRKVLLGK